MDDANNNTVISFSLDTHTDTEVDISRSNDAADGHAITDDCDLLNINISAPKWKQQLSLSMFIFGSLVMPISLFSIFYFS